MKILYKVVSAALALAVLPVLIFVPMISYAVESDALSLISDSKYIADNVSVYYIIDAVKQYSFIGSGNESGNLSSLKAPILVCVVFLALIALAAILTAVFSIVYRKKLPACCTAIFGIVFTYMFSTAFNNLVGPFVDGTTSLADFFDQWWIAFVADIEYIILSGGYYYLYMLFAAVLVWAVLFTLTEPKNKEVSSGNAKSSYTKAQ